MSFFDLEVLKKKTHKIQRNNAPYKFFLKIFLVIKILKKKKNKQTKFAIHMDL
jgi:hypothetical protein